MYLIACKRTALVAAREHATGRLFQNLSGSHLSNGYGVCSMKGNVLESEIPAAFYRIAAFTSRSRLSRSGSLRSR